MNNCERRLFNLSNKFGIIFQGGKHFKKYGKKGQFKKGGYHDKNRGHKSSHNHKEQHGHNTKYAEKGQREKKHGSEKHHKHDSQPDHNGQSGHHDPQGGYSHTNQQVRNLDQGQKPKVAVQDLAKSTEYQGDYSYVNTKRQPPARNQRVHYEKDSQESREQEDPYTNHERESRHEIYSEEYFDGPTNDYDEDYGDSEEDDEDKRQKSSPTHSEDRQKEPKFSQPEPQTYQLFTFIPLLRNPVSDNSGALEASGSSISERMASFVFSNDDDSSINSFSDFNFDNFGDFLDVGRLF